MAYHQITLRERYRIGQLGKAGLCPTAIAQVLERHPSTILRELARNRTARGRYEAYPAHCYARSRRKDSRCHHRVRPAVQVRIQQLLAQRWSPEQIAGWGRRTGEFQVSHETIYRYIWADRRAGGQLYQGLRYAHRRRRRRVGRVRRGGPLGRPLTARPPVVERRRQHGHWEIDTLVGRGSPARALSAVERATGYLELGRLPNGTAAAFAARAIHLFRRQRQPVRTVTADNGTELTGYRRIEARVGTTFYFAAPYSAWQRGTNENTNGLIRQYLPKGTSLASLTQHECNQIARALNTRPRKRLGYRTPAECYLR